METLVGEVRTDVAGRAVPFPTKNCEARLLLGGDSGPIAVDEAVVRRITGEDGAYVAGQRAGDLHRCEVYSGSGLGHREIHFIAVFDWLKNLLFKGGQSPVPEE